MSYASTRDAEHLAHTEQDITDFIRRYPRQTPPASGRHTVILFPGGMGSRLLRATKRFNDANPGPQTFSYVTAWGNLTALIAGMAVKLGMHKDAMGTYRDLDDRMVIPDGPSEILRLGPITVGPYSGFTKWCENKGLDWFILGWDWRRPAGDAATFFVDHFLPRFQQRVLTELGKDPLDPFSIIGHSQGGMVVNTILRGNAPIVANLDKAITAGTPFYGYRTQLHRWFEGDEIVNGPFNVHKEKIKRVIASLPGCYEFQYMSMNTYTANRVALAADPVFPQPAYPSRDLTTGMAADPYNPQLHPSDPNKKRYPPPNITGFDPGLLAQGQMAAEALVTRLPPALEAKFYNLRGVRNVPDTADGVTWDWVSGPSFGQEPIEDVAMVLGDDTQPAWTTRLVTQPPSHCITVTGNIDHAFLMNCPETHAKLGTVLNV